MKVRGFQVAPAELEGHLLDSPLVSDACVVGVPDEYSGNLPFAFVVPSAEACERIKSGEEKLVKAQIAKVRSAFVVAGRNRSDESRSTLPVCCGCKGSVQALGRWSWFH